MRQGNTGMRDCRKYMIKYKWPIEEGSYKVGNPLHPTAVFLPSPNPLAEKTAWEMGVAIVGVCITANIGLEKVLCNIVSNPNIRWVIVYGEDNPGHKSGDAIIKLWRNGVDPETRRIIGAEGSSPYISNLPLEVIERFRRQAVVIDMLGVDDIELLKKVIHGTIQEPENAIEITVKGVKYRLYDPGAYLDEEPIIISLKDMVLSGKALADYVSPLYTFIYSKTIGGAWPGILSAIREHGLEYVDERGYRVREVLNIVVHITDPLEEPMIPRGYPKSRSELEEYFRKYYLTGGRHGFVYTYGERLLCYNCGSSNIDQLDMVINRLSRSRYTRRALLVLWNPCIDLYREEVPCITVVQFLVRRDKLHTIAYIRSNDMYLGWPANAYALARLSEYVASKIGVGVGSLTTHSVSAHIYI